MTKIRPTTKHWTLEKHEFYAVYHYAQQYERLLAKRAELKNTLIRAVETDGMPHSKEPGDPTGSKAAKIADLDQKIRVIEEAASEAGGDLQEWLLYGVTHETSYEYLRAKGIPCGKNIYYDRRRKFYYLLAQKI